MKSKNIIAIISVAIISIYSTYILYKKLIYQPPRNLFQTETPKKRNIYQQINATGTLEIKDHLKIGSLVAGTIKNIYVKENERVKKDQLLAEIDIGKRNTDVKKAKGELEKTNTELQYQENYFNRQKELYQSNQISKDFFEKVTRDYNALKATKTIKQADLEQKEIEFNNSKIKSPDDGIIVSVGISKGEGVTTDLNATVLFIIAGDITKMEASLDIDESDIGNVKKGQKVEFTVGTYLDRSFKGVITKVSYSPKLKNNILSYKATVDVENVDLALRPGMTLNAKIKVAKCINCLSISSQAFQINSKLLEKIAKKLNYGFQPLEKRRKKSLEKSNNLHYSIKYVWILENKSFVEKAIKINITDDNYFELKLGISESDYVVIDIEEPDEMENLYKKFFKGAF